MTTRDLNSFLFALEHQKFFGSVELKYESGHVVVVRKSETLKQADIIPAQGERDEHANR